MDINWAMLEIQSEKLFCDVYFSVGGRKVGRSQLIGFYCTTSNRSTTSEGRKGEVLNDTTSPSPFSLPPLPPVPRPSWVEGVKRTIRHATTKMDERAPRPPIPWL